MIITLSLSISSYKTSVLPSQFQLICDLVWTGKILSSSCFLFFFFSFFLAPLSHRISSLFDISYSLPDVQDMLPLTKSEGSNHFIPTAFPILTNMLFLFPQMLPDIRFSFGGEINEARNGHKVRDSEHFFKLKRKSWWPCNWIY